jgi:hypothetical protein
MSTALSVTMDALTSRSQLRITGATAELVHTAQQAVVDYIASVRVTAVIPLPQHMQTAPTAAAAAATDTKARYATAATDVTTSSLLSMYSVSIKKAAAAAKATTNSTTKQSAAAAAAKQSKAQLAAADSAYRAKEALTNDIRGVARTFAVTCDITGTSVVLKGSMQAVAAAKKHVTELIAGVSTAEVLLTSEQAAKLSDVNCRRVAATSKTGDIHVYVDTVKPALIITGPYHAVIKAKVSTVYTLYLT